MHPLRGDHFTNEFGRPVNVNDFRGQAVVITFFYTRCPLPEFRPLLPLAGFPAR
jgi:protein SCO1/2